MNVRLLTISAVRALCAEYSAVRRLSKKNQTPPATKGVRMRKQRMIFWLGRLFLLSKKTPPAQRLGKSPAKKRSARREDCDGTSFAPSRECNASLPRMARPQHDSS